MPELKELSTDREVAVLDVDVVPRQTDCFTAAQAGHSDQLIERTESIGCSVIEELSKLVRLPRPNPRPGRWPHLHMNGRVDREALLAYRRVQRRT
ncbi:MAG TPA: hypothetical protein VIJ96_01215 [Acidothermaceae bacterium]